MSIAMKMMIILTIIPKMEIVEDNVNINNKIIECKSLLRRVYDVYDNLKYIMINVIIDNIEYR